jgi:hypothetical protein
VDRIVSFLNLALTPAKRAALLQALGVRVRVRVRKSKGIDGPHLVS